MGLSDVVRKYRPRLPRLTDDRPVIWALDPHPEETPRDQYSFMLIVGPDEEEITLLANRTGDHLAFTDQTLLEEHESDDEKYIEFGSTPLTLREFRILSVEETEERTTEEDGVRGVPTSLQDEVLVPKEFTPEDAEAIADLV